jgi:hypothetical protein
MPQGATGFSVGACGLGVGGFGWAKAVVQQQRAAKVSKARERRREGMAYLVA